MTPAGREALRAKYNALRDLQKTLREAHTAAQRNGLHEVADAISAQEATVAEHANAISDILHSI